MTLAIVGSARDRRRRFAAEWLMIGLVDRVDIGLNPPSKTEISAATMETVIFSHFSSVRCIPLKR
jgi:hypothetical protein